MSQYNLALMKVIASLEESLAGKGQQTYMSIFGNSFKIDPGGYSLSEIRTFEGIGAEVDEDAEGEYTVTGYVNYIRQAGYSLRGMLVGAASDNL